MANEFASTTSNGILKDTYDDKPASKATSEALIRRKKKLEEQNLAVEVEEKEDS